MKVGSAGLQNLLDAAGDGDVEAIRELRTAFYDELRGVARRLMVTERQGHTLEPTALVNEAVLRILSAGRLTEFENSLNYYVSSATMMLQRSCKSIPRPLIRKRVLRFIGHSKHSPKVVRPS